MLKSNVALLLVLIFSIGAQAQDYKTKLEALYHFKHVPDDPVLGSAYELAADPAEGITWGSMQKSMNLKDAKECCECTKRARDELGCSSKEGAARLPTVEDFLQLSELQSHFNFEVIPALLSHGFWTASNQFPTSDGTIVTLPENEGYYFKPESNTFLSANSRLIAPVLCVEDADPEGAAKRRKAWAAKLQAEVVRRAAAEQQQIAYEQERTVEQITRAYR